MTLTREDVLRELDLLPVWQLRQAMPIAEVVDMPETKQAIENEEEVPHVKEVAPVAEKVAMPWVLVYDVAQDQLQAGKTLLQNIIKAMRLARATRWRAL